jgi:hypothetical protein
LVEGDLALVGKHERPADPPPQLEEPTLVPSIPGVERESIARPGAECVAATARLGRRGAAAWSTGPTDAADARAARRTPMGGRIDHGLHELGCELLGASLVTHASGVFGERGGGAFVDGGSTVGHRGRRRIAATRPTDDAAAG